MNRSLALIAAFFAVPAFADSPLPPPETLTVCSASRNTCAISDPATSTTRVSSPKSRVAPWTIPGWHRWLFVSDDETSVVVGYDGMNLVPVDVTLEEPVFFFYSSGKLVRVVTLGDLYKRKSQLVRTVSHLAWAQSARINGHNQLVVELMDGRKMAFAASTGKLQPLVADGTRQSTSPGQ